MNNTIYLDYAAATPVSPEVFTAMQPYFSQRFFNPSANYGAAREVAKDIEAARFSVAHQLGARSTEILFTAGGTEANNLAVHGVMSQFPDANIVVSSVEHDAVLLPARQYACREVAVKPTGLIDVESLAKTIDDSTVLVSVMYANNEIGTIQPIKKIAKTINEVRAVRRKNGNELPIYLHTDACQAANYLDLHVDRLGVDLMTLNGGKIYGPKQSGILYVKTGTNIEPIIRGGGQEFGKRSGTENVANIIGFARALELVQQKRHEESERIAALQRLFIEKLSNQVPQAVINGTLKHRLPNNVHVTFPGKDNERLLFALDERGIICAVGSACSASSQEPSHVLRAIGLSDSEARSSLRFSFGQATMQADIERTVQELASLAA